MPDFDPYQLSRPAGKTETRTFTDPAHPDKPLTLTLHMVNEAPTRLTAYARIQENQETYVDGKLRPSTGQPDEVPGRFPPTRVLFRKAGESSEIALNASTCRLISVLQSLEVRGEEGGAVRPMASVDYWAAVSVTIPSAFLEAGLWASRMLEGMPDEEEGEAPADPSSAPTAD